MFCAVTLNAQITPKKPGKIDSTLTTKPLTAAQRDSIRLSRRVVPLVVGRDSVNRPDTARQFQRDSIQPQSDTFNLRLSKDTLDAPVNYEAEDSAVILVPEKKIILYTKAKTTYKDVVLTAPRIDLDQRSNVLTASNELDSLGEVLTRARFEQAENKFESDTIQFNFKTQRGFTKNTFTNQNEMFIQGELIKKVDSATIFVSRGRFTTCDLDEPHFAFRASKLKVINGKVAISGPMHPEFEGVPVPVYLPFGFYPLSKGRHSGLLPAQFTATENFGVGLEGLGYYKVLSDNFDVTFRTNLYSYGGWRADLTPTYRVRYRYNGSLNLSVQNTKINFKGDPDFNQTKTFNIAWTHSVDQRARPGVSFSANVNAGSSKYNRFVTNNVMRPFQNQLGSSISYQKVWKGKPYNLTLSANHNQNNATRLYNVILPDASFTVNTLFPFERQEAVGSPKWYEKFGIGYNGTMRNQVSFYDTAFSFQKLADTLQWGASHNIPLTVALPSLGPLLVSPSISYQQQWAMRRLLRTWDPTRMKVDTTFEKGFYTAHNLAFGLGFNTSFFGTYQFRNSRVLAIRHTVRPTFSVSYSPNLAKNYYRTVQIDTSGNFLQYSLYEGNLFQGFSNIDFGGISFGIDNNLEMKRRTRKDTVAQKLRLIDGFGFSSSYNFLQDSLQLGDFNLYLRSSLFDKINLNMQANLTPYETDQFGRRIARFVWENGGFSPGRFTSGSISLSTSFRSKPRDPSKESQPTATNPNRITDPTLLGDQQRLREYMRRNPAEFVDFNIPYDFSIDLAINFNRQLQPDLKGYKNVFSSSLNFNNSFSLTPKWNFSTNGYLDVVTKKLQAFSININRDLHCWQMSIGVTPVGFQRYFNISISPKSSLLQNLKVNRTRIFNDF